MAKSEDLSQTRAGGPSTCAVHGGEARAKLGNAITEPIVQTATYTFANSQEICDHFEGRIEREEYGRYGNPNEKTAEKKLAALEGGEDAILFSSGMAAIVGLLTAKLSARDEGVFFDECFHRDRGCFGKARSPLRRAPAAAQGGQAEAVLSGEGPSDGEEAK